MFGREQTEVDYILESRMQLFVPPNHSAPTQARPGSSEKLRVMVERYGSGQPLHHPGDANWLLRKRTDLLQSL